MAHPLLAARRPLVGVVHLPPLAGPRSPGLDALLARAEADAAAYAAAGFDAVLVENFGDVPFPKGASPPHAVAVMARAVAAAARASRLPTGANLLRNDTIGALAACHAGGGAFVRVNVFTGAMLTDQGVVEGEAHAVLAYRDLLWGEKERRPLVCADVAVKHASPLVPRRLEDEAHETVHRARADVVLVTGTATGRPVDLEEIRRAKAGAGQAPVWAASGVDADNAAAVLAVADGAIVGSAAKQDGVTGRPVDPVRAAAIVAAARRV